MSSSSKSSPIKPTRFRNQPIHHNDDAFFTDHKDFQDNSGSFNSDETTFEVDIDRLKEFARDRVKSSSIPVTSDAGYFPVNDNSSFNEEIIETHRYEQKTEGEPEAVFEMPLPPENIETPDYRKSLNKSQNRAFSSASETLFNEPLLVFDLSNKRNDLHAQNVTKNDYDSNIIDDVVHKIIATQPLISEDGLLFLSKKEYTGRGFLTRHFLFKVLKRNGFDTAYKRFQTYIKDTTYE